MSESTGTDEMTDTEGREGHDEAAGEETGSHRESGSGAAGAGASPAPAPSDPASLDDPHFQPYAKHPERAEAAAGLFLLVGLLGFCAYGAAYWVNLGTQWQGVFLGVGLFCFGFGLAAWGKYLLPQGPFEEERHSVASTEVEREELAAALVDRGQMVVRRRRVLGTLLGAGAAVMGVVLAFPLLRSLGPVPDKTLDTTHWKKGSRLVDIDGNIVTVDTLVQNGSITVFPEGHAGDGIDQTFLLRPGQPYVVSGPSGVEELAYPDMVTAPGRESWGPQGYLAFSKVCTHAGCPVGLFQHQTQQLLCPCHQSLFDVRPSPDAPDGVNAAPAVPVFGPAPRPLPQLPLAVAADGKTLVAQGPYDQPPGPGFWERS